VRTTDRDVAQLGSALDWGSRGRRFKSCHPDGRAVGNTDCKTVEKREGHWLRASALLVFCASRRSRLSGASEGPGRAGCMPAPHRPVMSVGCASGSHGGESVGPDEVSLLRSGRGSSSAVGDGEDVVVGEQDRDHDLRGGEAAGAAASSGGDVSRLRRLGPAVDAPARNRSDSSAPSRVSGRTVARRSRWTGRPDVLGSAARRARAA
jgi:hypothetical protein